MVDSSTPWSTSMARGSSGRRRRGSGSGNPGGLAGQDVGHAGHRLLPAVERHEQGMALPDLFGFEAHGHRTDAAEPKVGLALLEGEGDPAAPGVEDGQLEPREVLQEAVEERGGHEEVSVLHIGDRLGNGVRRRPLPR